MPRKVTHLSRRERQIMDVIYRMQRATAAEVMDHLPDAPSYSAVRALLRILEDKGHLKHYQDGVRYVYQPAVPKEHASRFALEHLKRTFFEGSTEQVVAALLDVSSADLSDDELQRMQELIEQARKEGR